MRISACLVLPCLAWCLAAAGLYGQPVPNVEHPLKLVSPADGETLASFLMAVLRWEYPQRPAAAAPFPFLRVNLQVADNRQFANPLVNVDLDDHQTSFRVALAPERTYYWRLIPFGEANGVAKYLTSLQASASFRTGKPRNLFAAGDSLRYENPREGAHWQYMQPVVPKTFEPLAPWYDVKAYRTAPPPSLAEIKSQFPVPVWDGHPEALAAYWYCWDTLLRVWMFAPQASDHQAVANLLGYRNWGPWGSTMVWDSCFILHFARYGAQAYPFITCLDNCYARQHENGFICRESDRENREVYATYPVNPPLFAWAEWEWYQLTGDKQRLARVLLPLVRHYQWWMTYQRRENGLYWVQGLNEADDSPRNELMYYSASATSYQALAALYLSRIAKELGRADLQLFFDRQHEELKALVNARLWDQRHQLYNDLTREGRFITELQPGVFCKHVHMFWPLMAKLVPSDRLPGIIRELKNPASFNRSSGIPSLSADSKGYNAENGQYWRGAVWPSAQCMVQEGLAANGQRELLQETAEKYYRACLKAYRDQGTIRENLAPDKPVGFGAQDFVGWGGIGPVANFIEYILGFDVDSPGNTITWRITRLERHGLQNLEFRGFKADLICEARTSPGEPCRIAVKSGGSFLLKLAVGGHAVQRQIRPGTQTFEIAAEEKRRPTIALAVRPVIRKLGTIDCDLVETTPIVFRDRLYRAEYVRERYQHKASGETGSYFRLIDVAKREALPPFARGYHLLSAIVEGDQIYAFGVEKWGADKIAMFCSRDLKTWKSQNALQLPRTWTAFNTSVCKGRGGYVMAIELGGPPEVVGVPFTIRFAQSSDLQSWKLIDERAVYAKDRYTSSPTIRFLDTHYYMLYCEALPGPVYPTYVVRSKDLVHWEQSPLNPVMTLSDEDRGVSPNAALTVAERARIATARNVCNSDVDLCQFGGKVYFYYCWGNQTGIEHLAEARYDGTLKGFFQGFFPETEERKANR